MARKRKKFGNPFGFVRMPRLDLEPDTKKGIFIVLILAVGAISLLGLFDKAGLMGEFLRDWLVSWFGWGRFFLPILLLAWGYALFDEERFSLRGSNYFGSVLFLASISSLLMLFVSRVEWEAGIILGSGGGYVGYYFGDFLIKIMGYIAALLVSLGLLVISFMLMFNTTLVRMFGRDSYFAKIIYPINLVLGKLLHLRKKEDEDGEREEEDEADNEEGEDENEEENEDESGEDEDGGEDENEDEEDKENEEDEEETDGDEEDNEDDGEEDRPGKSAAPAKEEETIWWMKPGRRVVEIPLSLLNGKSGKAQSGNIEENKNIIKKSLDNFGIPVEMGAVAVGPTVTQYTFRPAEGVKLSRVTNLSNDLALALAAHPIRIEAPIPGKALVGVEVPNQAKAVVSLKEILLSKNYQNRKNDQQIALGKDVAGASWTADITKMPHLLVAGATNSGKSVCLNTIIISLMYQNSPDDIKFIMVDPKRVELVGYNGIPYLLAPVITEVGKTINALKWCLNEMDRRFDILAKSGQRNIQSYNEANRIKMPFIVFIIDELADLMVGASKDIEPSIIRLAQMARAVGIHLILATQRPSVDVITGLIKANMPARIAFSVASSTDSRTILDCLGAEKLLGRGDMLFANAELSKPVRLQGAFLSDEEIKRVVKYVKSKGGVPEYVGGITERQKVTGNAGVGLDGVTGDEDELLSEARDTVVNMGKASASLLQRKLRIGYARAASILDQLEEAGVIGPSNGAKPREILMNKRDLANLERQGTSGVSLHRREESRAPENYFEDESEDPPVFSERKTENRKQKTDVKPEEDFDDDGNDDADNDEPSDADALQGEDEHEEEEDGGDIFEEADEEIENEKDGAEEEEDSFDKLFAK